MKSKKITEKETNPNKKSKDFFIPIMEICRAILWVLDKQRGEEQKDCIPLYDVVIKSEINSTVIKNFLRRFDGKGIKIIYFTTNEKKIHGFEISKMAEDYIRNFVTIA